MIKKTLGIIFFSLAVLAFCPILLMRLTTQETGMGMMLFLLMLVNPLFCLMLGIVAGKDIYNSLYYPFIPLIIFVAAMTIFFDNFEMTFLVYGIVYFVITLVSMIVTRVLIVYKEKKSMV